MNNVRISWVSISFFGGKLVVLISSRPTDSSRNDVLPPPPRSKKLKTYHGPRRQIDTSSTNFPRSDFKGETIIRRSMEIRFIIYKFALSIFIVSILFNSELWVSEATYSLSKYFKFTYEVLRCDRAGGGQHIFPR